MAHWAKRFAVLALVGIVLVPLAAGAQTLTILHTNDTHGHLLPFSYPRVVPAGSAEERIGDRSNIGGIARRATLANRIRGDLKRQGTPVWLVDAGDFSDGTAFSVEYRGEADVAAMNATRYTFATLGNHEFNYPLAHTKRLIELAGYPILCANAIDKASGRPLVNTHVFQGVGPLTIGVFGLVTREAASYPAAKEGIVIQDELDTARSMVARLRKRAHIIILISHAGEEMDRRLAAEVPGIDVIVGGHSHSRLPVGEFMWRSESLKEDEVNGTIVVQAHQWAGELGRLDLRFKRNRSGIWRVSRYRARLIPITPDIPEDARVAAVVNTYWQPISPKYAEIIGQAAGDFSARCDDRAEYNLVADAVRSTFGTEIEFENMGGVRAPLVAGPITRGDVIAMDPFDNTVLAFSLPGREVKRILQQYAPAVSGLRYRIENGTLVEATIGGQPIDDDRVYSGTTNSYFAKCAFKGIELQETGRYRLDVLLDYIRRQGSVQPTYDGRRVILGSPLASLEKPMPSEGCGR